MTAGGKIFLLSPASATGLRARQLSAPRARFPAGGEELDYAVIDAPRHRPRAAAAPGPPLGAHSTPAD